MTDMNDLGPELAAALVEFQAAAPTITKSHTALIPTKSGGSYSYKYASLADIWDAIRQPLKANGLAVTQSLSGGSDGFMGVRTTVWHQSGQHFSDLVELPISGRTPQEVGSQITYFKRYALSAVLGLSTEEDDDGAAASRKPTPPARTELDDALDELGDMVAGLGLNRTEVAARFVAQYKVVPRKSDAHTVRQFTTQLSDDAPDPNQGELNV